MYGNDVVCNISFDIIQLVEQGMSDNRIVVQIGTDVEWSKESFRVISILGFTVNGSHSVALLTRILT